PPQTGQDPSCTAANAQSLIEKALALCSEPHFLQQQHVVFPQNRLIAADLRVAAIRAIPPRATIVNGPERTLTEESRCCVAPRRSGHSLHEPNMRSGEGQDCGQSPVRFLGSNDRCVGMPMGASELATVEDLGQASPTWVIQVLF
ncbi:hypothetical protein, partial [Roseovarius gaetbuli]|uniref:hypothetical protein n=1 Tax=Roseovarius gaetbuli TaxID=1356575 RepID=UPI001BB0573E